MKHNSTKAALRLFFRAQIICLCLTLAGVGACVAAERTAYTAQGAPAAVQSDTAVRSVVSRLPDKPALASLAEFAPLLPAPAGNLAAVYYSVQKIIKTDGLALLDNLHNFFR